MFDMTKVHVCTNIFRFLIEGLEYISPWINWSLSLTLPKRLSIDRSIYLRISIFPSYSLSSNSFLYTHIEYRQSVFFTPAIAVAGGAAAALKDFGFVGSISHRILHSLLLRLSSLIHTYFINLTVYQLSIAWNVWKNVFPPFSVIFCKRPGHDETHRAKCWN